MPMKGRDEKGLFQPGNRFWEARSTAGPKPKFANADDLWNACVEYFEWNETNPLYLVQLVIFQGNAKHEPVPKMRAMTIAGLCMFLDVSQQTWQEWRHSRADLSAVITRVDDAIRRQKFEGAAAEMLHPNIIARDLGLRDATSSEISGPAGGPVEAVTGVRLEFVRPDTGTKNA